MSTQHFTPAFAPQNVQQPAQLLIPKALGLNKRVKAHLQLLPNRPRDFGYHPSELHKFCPVLHYLVAQARENLLSDNPEEVRAAFEFMRRWVESRRGSPGLEMELEIGNDIHDIVKGWLGTIGVLWGRWHCANCGAPAPEAEGYMPRTHVPDIGGQPVLAAAPCRVCIGRNLHLEHRAWAYEEYAMHEDSEYARAVGIKGHMDGDIRLVVDGVPQWGILEIKSNKQEDLKGVTNVALPKPQHITQSSIYAWIKGRRWIVIVYVNKNQINEWKEFVIPVDMNAVAAVKAKIDAANEGLRVGKAPTHARICADIRERQARDCVAVEQCFGAKPPESWI